MPDGCDDPTVSHDISIHKTNEKLPYDYLGIITCLRTTFGIKQFKKLLSAVLEKVVV